MTTLTVLRSALSASLLPLALTAGGLAGCDSPGGGEPVVAVDCSATPSHPYCRASQPDATSGAEVHSGPCTPYTTFCSGNIVLLCQGDGSDVDYVETCGEGLRCDPEAAACVCAPQCSGLQCGPDGCGGTCGACGPDELCFGGQCLIDKKRHFAVLIQDSPDHECSNNSKNHGADMDAMELVDGSDSLAFADSVDGVIGDLGGGVSSVCGPVNPNSTDLNAFKGAPDATLMDGFVALGGGWLIAEFSGGLEILPAYTLYVYEQGVAECGSQGCRDESYSVHLTPGLTNASIRTTVSGSAAGTAIIDLTGI